MISTASKGKDVQRTICAKGCVTLSSASAELNQQLSVCVLREQRAHSGCQDTVALSIFNQVSRHRTYRALAASTVQLPASGSILVVQGCSCSSVCSDYMGGTVGGINISGETTRASRCVAGGGFWIVVAWV